MAHVGKRLRRKGSQRRDEIEAFIALLRREKCRSYLEIGLRLGATFLEVGRRLPPKSTMVGIDFPGAVWGVRSRDTATAIVEIERTATLLRRRQQEVRVLWGSSRSTEIIDNASRFAPYDAVMIDGDHSAEGVRADWAAYAPMARIVALHDIDAAHGKLLPDRLACYGVPELWAELKPNFRHREIIGSVRGMGLGVIWREA